MLSSAVAAALLAAPPAAGPAPIEALVIHPPLAGHFVCGDHAEDQSELMDRLGTDCQLTANDDPAGKPRSTFLRLYRGDGSRNEDWFSWRAPVLALFDGTVLRVLKNGVVNRPGVKGRPPAATIIFAREDGTRVAYAHLAEMRVKAGDRVKAGQQVALVGNNGPSYAPHIHIGAWRGKAALQLRMDQRAMAALWEAEWAKDKPVRP